jgi:hypothetical protein
MGPGRSERLALAALVLAAALHYAWNAFTVAPLAEYDGGGHAAYILTIVDEGRLPHPLEGWSTFHPPLYYLLAAGVWRLCEPFGPRALMAGLRAISAVAMLGCGVLSFLAVRRLGGGPAVALVATTLVLFVPVVEMAAVMIGNEPLAAFLAAATLSCLLALQRDPRRPALGALAGLLGGLGLATKYTAIVVALTCLVPFVRRDFDRRMAHALVACALAGSVIALPVYLRNLSVTGVLTPMSRDLEPMRGVEESYVLHPRSLADYLWVPLGALLRPSIVHLPDGPPRPNVWNESMQSVWGLTYAAFWYDPFGHRIPLRFHRTEVWAGPLLTLLGLVPTGLMLLGFAAATGDLIRLGSAAAHAPLTVFAWLTLGAFVAITWYAPSMVAVKGSYLLPALVPAAAFFARVLGLLPGRARKPALALATVPAVVAAAVFTSGLVFPPDPTPRFIRGWEMTGRYVAGGRIEEAARRLDPLFRRPRTEAPPHA